MKRYLFILSLLFSIAYGQTVTQSFTPTGISKFYGPGGTMSGVATVGNIYIDTIYANTLVPGKNYEFDIFCSLTTPALLLPTLTLNVVVGSTSLTLTSSSLLAVSLTKKAFKIHVTVFGNSSSTQYIYAELFSDNGVLTLGSNYYAKSATASEDMTVDKPIKVTAQFSNTTGLSGTTLYIDNVYKEPF